MKLTFSEMPAQSQRHCFRLWQQENPNESGLAEYKEGYDWLFAIDISTQQVIGFAAIHQFPLIATTLEMIYVYPRYRHQGLSITIRRALVKAYDLKGLTIPRYDDDPDKLERHRAVARASGFSQHYVIAIDNGLQRRWAAESVFRDDINPHDHYHYPFSVMAIDDFLNQSCPQEAA